MVTGVITASDFSNFEPKLIAETRYTLQYKTLMPQLYRREKLTPNMGRTYNVPKHGTVTATALTEGVPLAVGQVPTQGNTAITPSEAGVEVILTDVALSSGRDDYARQMGRVMGDAMAKKLDQDGLAKFTDYTAIGSAGTAAAVGHITAAVARLGAATEPCPKPWWLVHRPEAVRSVLNSIAPTGTYPVPTGISQEVLEQYYMHDFRLFGLNGGFATANLSKDSSTDDATGAIFSQQSHLFVEAHPVQFERDRDIELRGWLLTAVSRYAFGSYNTNWGVGWAADAATPVA